MKKLKITNYIDNFFLYIIMFFISFIWIRYFVEDLIITILSSIVISYIFYKLINFANRHRYDKKSLSIKTKKHIDDCAIHLLFNSTKKNIEFFDSILKNSYNTVTKDNMIFSNTKGVICFVPFFETTHLDINNLAKIYKQSKIHNVNVLHIFCIEYDKNLISFVESIKDINIKLYDKSMTYINLFQKYKVFPKSTLCIDTSKKYTFKLLLNIAFAPNKAKSYLFCSLIFLICSLFIRYNLYYLIMSSLLLIFCFICIFNKSKIQNNDGL